MTLVAGSRPRSAVRSPLFNTLTGMQSTPLSYRCLVLSRPLSILRVSRARMELRPPVTVQSPLGEVVLLMMQVGVLPW